MSEENKKLNDEELKQIAGGNDGMGDGTFSVVDIPDTWVRVTASELNCRYWPNGNIAKTYEYGHRLKVDGITTDGLWYRLWIYNPQGGECNGYIYKAYTEPI
ncbi:MAG: bacteriocin [Lachnospiraceae bacterium]|jgi:bacteriocin-like protein|nr:bacteriocin [Lachnospiraceae bacterium]